MDVRNQPDLPPKKGNLGPHLEQCKFSVCIASSAALAVLMFVSCVTDNHSSAKEDTNLFSITNAFVDGRIEYLVKAKFGLRIMPTRTDVTIQFGTNDYINILFNRDTLKPESILLKITGRDGKGQSVFDANADGIPDIRRIEGEDKRQLFLGGEWYFYETSGSNAVIDFNGKPVPFFFDGNTWRENTNSTSKSKSPPGPERTDKALEEVPFAVRN